MIGYHVTSKKRAALIQSEGLRVNAHKFTFPCGKHHQPDHQALHGCNPIFFALDGPTDLAGYIAKHLGVSMDDLRVIEVDLTGLDLQVDLPVLYDRCNLDVQGTRLQLRKDACDREREKLLLEQLQRAAGSTKRRRVFPTALLNHEDVRPHAINITRTVTVAHDIEPERIGCVRTLVDYIPVMTNVTVTAVPGNVKASGFVRVGFKILSS